MEEARTFEGSCHCGAVRYEVKMAPPAKAVSGNCSICSRSGSVLTFVPEGDFRLLSGEDKLKDYQFNKHVVHHLFCTTCGVRSFARGKDRSGAAVMAVNLRCVPAVDTSKLDITHFDCAAM